MPVQNYRSHARSAMAVAMPLAALLFAVGARASSQSPVMRAAAPAGAIKHVMVIDLENENYAVTFNPNSAAQYFKH